MHPLWIAYIDNFPLQLASFPSSIHHIPYVLEQIFLSLCCYHNAGDLYLFQSFHACLSPNVVIKHVFRVFQYASSFARKLLAPCCHVRHGRRKTAYGTFNRLRYHKGEDVPIVCLISHATSRRACQTTSPTASLPNEQACFGFYVGTINVRGLSLGFVAASVPV